MYTADDYFYGWLFYLIGVIIVMACGWVLTSFISHKPTRFILRLVAAVFFLVPWYASPELDFLAPAWLIAAFEAIFDGPNAFWRAGGPLLTAITLVLLSLLGIRLFMYFSAKRALAEAQEEA